MSFRATPIVLGARRAAINSKMGNKEFYKGALGLYALYFSCRC